MPRVPSAPDPAHLVLEETTPHPDLSAGSPPEDCFPPALARGLEWSPRKASSITLSGLLSMACRRQAGFGRTKLSSESRTARTGGA